MIFKIHISIGILLQAVVCYGKNCASSVTSSKNGLNIFGGGADPES